MPSQHRFSRKAQDSTLGKIIDEFREGRQECLNALDMIESSMGLNITLYPAQRVILRCIFGIPFDYKPLAQAEKKWKYVPVYDKFRERLLYKFTEEEYLKYVADEGRCNISDWRDLPPKGYNEACIFAGRRGGKSQLISAIGAYQLYRLLHIRSPQEYYDLVPNSPIDLTFFAQDEEGAGRLLGKLKEDVLRSSFFTPYLKHTSNTKLSFVTEADRDKSDVTPTITAYSFPCTTNAARGPSSIFLVLDEFAHFRSEKGSSSDDMYEAATPATISFDNPEGEREAMVITISSPLTRIGKMYELHKLALKEGASSSVFTWRTSTAEMNPRANAKYLRDELKKKALTWKAEYGGEFLDSSESYVTNLSLGKCKSERPNIIEYTQLNQGRDYFWGFDLGMANDAAALAVAHYEVHERTMLLVYDYIDRMIVGEAWAGCPSVPAIEGRYDKYKELDIYDIEAWLLYVHKIYPCFKGGTDQHAGRQMVQRLIAQGIQNMELLPLSAGINSQMYFALKGMIDHATLSFPKSEKFYTEVHSLEAEFASKYQIRVRAPAEKGAHDDMADAAAIAAYLAQKHIDDNDSLRRDPEGRAVTVKQQQALSPSPIQNLTAVPLTTLQIIERKRQTEKLFGFDGSRPTLNPFHRRYRK